MASILVFVAASCKKDTIEFIPKDTITIVESDTSWDNDLSSKSNLSTNLLPTLNIEKLVNQLSPSPLSDTCNAERGGTIEIPNNVTVNIPANSCLNAQNRLCTGKLDVEILILRKKGDFILYNLPTSSGNRQLISGGVVSVKMRQNGQDVHLVLGKTIKLRYVMPEPDNSMQLFEGKLDGRFNFDWIQLPPVGLGNVRPTVTPWADSSQRRGYDLVLDRFGLINCDKFVGDSTNFNNKFVVTLSPSFTNINTAVYVAFKDMNSVLSLAGDAHTKAFLPNGRGLPIGRVVTVISMSYIKDKFYFAKQEVTVQSSTGTTQTVSLAPAIMEKDAIKEILKTL